MENNGYILYDAGKVIGEFIEIDEAEKFLGCEIVEIIWGTDYAGDCAVDYADLYMADGKNYYLDSK